MNYSSRPIRLSDGYIVYESPCEWIEYTFHRHPVIREQARFMMKMYIEHGPHNRWPWWRLNPPPTGISVRTFRLSPVDRLGGRALVLWLLFKLVTGR